jgi:hypothetical protein
MAKRCPYQAIMMAAANGRGLRLTAEEAEQLSGDGAIETVANNGLSEEDVGLWQGVGHWEFWRRLSNRRSTTTCSKGNEP